MSHPVVHFEILGRDGAKLQAFYKKALGWKIDANNPLKYGVVEAQEGGIGGGVASSQDGSTSVCVYVQADDPQSMLDKITKLGGRVILPVSQIPGANVTIAQFADPDGNVVGLYKA